MSDSCLEERRRWRRGEGEDEEEERASGCGSGGVVRGTSVGASSLSFLKSCFQNRALRGEACRDVIWNAVVAVYTCVCACLWLNMRYVMRACGFMCVRMCK